MLSKIGPTRTLVLGAAVVAVAIWSYFDFALPAGNAVPAAAAVTQTEAQSMSERFAEAHPSEAAVRSRDGVWIHYDDSEEGEQTLLFVHGWNCDRSYWQLQRDFLAEQFRVVTIDLAGHGESGLTRENWSIAAFADDVIAVAEGLDLERITLVGHSMGGNVVVAAAAGLGERLERIVAVDTLRRPDMTLPRETIRATLDNMDVDYSGTVAAIVQTMFVESSSARIRDFVVRDMASSPPAVGRGALLALAAHNPMRELRALAVPMVLINSDYQPTRVDVLDAAVTDFEYVEMPGLGHFVMLEDPLEFTNLLLAAIR